MTLEITNYPEGTLVTVRGTFTNSTGTLHDPTAVYLDVKEPNSALLTYTFGVGAQITKASTGIYESNLNTIGKRGLWLYTWYATGAGQADSGEKEFYVE
jgi:hypothetical protein